MKEFWLMGIYLMGFLGTGVNLGPQQLRQYYSGPMWTPFVTFGHDASDPSGYRTFKLFHSTVRIVAVNN